MNRVSFVASLCLAFGLLLASRPAAAEEKPVRVLIVVGPSSHPPGTHEVAAGARLVEYCLEHASNVSHIQADVIDAWPADPGQLENVAALVFSGDQFPPERMAESDRILSDVWKMMDRGCGIVCFHYATGISAADVEQDGDHPLLHWMGGYFATRTPHHQSTAKVFTATIEPGPKPHPVNRGWKPFRVHDEPYINNYFGPNGPEPNVTALAVAQLPPEMPKAETVAWAVSREDGGRGAGIVMPHFYQNWKDENLRMLILNAVVWSAGREVPEDGVKTELPDLTTFAPEAVEPQPRPAR